MTFVAFLIRVFFHLVPCLGIFSSLAWSPCSLALVVPKSKHSFTCMRTLELFGYVYHEHHGATQRLSGCLLTLLAPRCFVFRQGIVAASYLTASEHTLRSCLHFLPLFRGVCWHLLVSYGMRFDNFLAVCSIHFRCDHLAVFFFWAVCLEFVPTSPKSSAKVWARLMM